MLDASNSDEQAANAMRIPGRHIATGAPPLSLPAFILMTGLGLGLATSQDAAAEAAHAGVVELFTSQGCPKCPPADRTIARLAKTPGTIALSFPVAMWDYIGWKDTLASPAFATRQRAYAAARGDQMIFTPQAIVDGVDVEAGGDRSAILDDMARLSAQRHAMDIPIHLSESDGRLHVAVGGEDTGDQHGTQTPAPIHSPIGVYVLRVAHAKTVEIDRGANSGHSVTYTNVVRAMTRVGAWTGTPAHFDILELKGDGEGYVVLLQEGTPEKPGLILAAAKAGDL